MKLTRPHLTPWTAPAQYWPQLAEATAELDPPYGVISLPALAHNAFDMLDRAKGTPIRVASKSVRVRGVLDAVLALPGYAGVLGYTLPEANWLATDSADGAAITDVVVAYPTADRAALRELATTPHLAARVTIMVDSVEQLDFVDSVIAPAAREPIRVCLELDASWDSKVFGHLGVRRSPVHTPDQARSLAEIIVARPGFTLVGMMGYEAQIAGLVNQPAGNPLRGVAVKWVQRQSAAELADRRGAAVAAVRGIADLEFVNGGGTGSIESTVAEEAVTEVAAGSGLFGPHLFDNYAHFHPTPAASFALSVVRKPQPDMAVLLGGGWIASGPTAADRSPKVVWPDGLKLLPLEMAGEVQSPLTGPPARDLAVGDRVWLRHTKAGEISEHLDEFAIVGETGIVETLPTYRGQGKVFL
ncbi:D-serine deaminase-like pyridoxal phosphate-dependent protein [Conyzicola lurida]|uniref:D-serine deaminase-like pyridoxal phosphate-dependent protein n=1 Tax=Conyzicola lurida TaxID=1172621 RepID=A0A841ALE0_9MICO|nr:D-serine deaminase-like pyridoxal phosphate-dependent protein [Conyzicola lurida]